MEEVLWTRDLGKRYGDFWALTGLDMHVPKGAIYGFVRQKRRRQNDADPNDLWFAAACKRGIYAFWSETYRGGDLESPPADGGLGRNALDL